MEESESYPKTEQLSESYHLCSELNRLTFVYGGAILALQKSLFIDWYKIKSIMSFSHYKRLRKIFKICDY